MNPVLVVIITAVVTGLLAAVNTLAGTVTDPTVLSVTTLLGAVLTAALGWLKREKPQDPSGGGTGTPTVPTP